MQLTDRTIKAAKTKPGLNQSDFRDDQVRGLVLRVYKSGVRTWFVCYRRKEDNRRRWMKLGNYPGVTLKQARELAEIEIGRTAAGEDPLAERQEIREAAGGKTVAELAEEFLERYSRVYKRPASYEMDRQQFDSYVLPVWGKRPAAEITKRDVRDILQALADGTIAPRGKPTKVAPRSLRALLSKLFNWATDEEYLPANPAAGVKLPVSVREHLSKGGRDRVLTDSEIATIWKQLDWLEDDAKIKSLAPVTAAAFRLILFTAQRPGEVMSMRWSDIEDGEWWRIPGEVAKNGQSHRVYLSPQAREVLRDLHPYTGDSEWVLESPRKPGRHLTTIKTANQGILRRCEMEHWSPHDLRRTAATKMRALGVSRRTVQGILNHKDRSVTAVYDRYGADPEKREALCTWGQRVEEIVADGNQQTVAQFRRRTEQAERPRVRREIAGGSFREDHLR